MSQHLPDRIDIVDFAEKKRHVNGRVPFSQMDRLGEMLSDRSGSAECHLAFAKEGRLVVVSGSVAADLALECQCCMETIVWPVRAEVRLGAVDSIDAANLLSETYEPLMMDADGCVSLLDLVQDELLLAVPPIPQHESCLTAAPRTKKDKADHPFSILAQLKKTPVQGE